MNRLTIAPPIPGIAGLVYDLAVSGRFLERDDLVFADGFNLRAGGRVDLSEPAIGTVKEFSYWVLDGGRPRRLMEWYVQAFGADGTDRRPIGCEVWGDNGRLKSVRINGPLVICSEDAQNVLAQFGSGLWIGPRPDGDTTLLHMASHPKATTKFVMEHEGQFGAALQFGDDDLALRCVRRVFALRCRDWNTLLERDVITIDDRGSATVGTPALSDAATDGFAYLPTIAGPPTGVPTAKPGFAPVCIEEASGGQPGRLWAYSGGAWAAAELAAPPSVMN